MILQPKYNKKLVLTLENKWNSHVKSWNRHVKIENFFILKRRSMKDFTISTKENNIFNFFV